MLVRIIILLLVSSNLFAQVINPAVGDSVVEAPSIKLIRYQMEKGAGIPEGFDEIYLDSLGFPIRFVSFLNVDQKTYKDDTRFEIVSYSDENEAKVILLDEKGDSVGVEQWKKTDDRISYYTFDDLHLPRMIEYIGGKNKYQGSVLYLVDKKEVWIEVFYPLKAYDSYVECDLYYIHLPLTYDNITLVKEVKYLKDLVNKSKVKPKGKGRVVFN